MLAGFKTAGYSNKAARAGAQKMAGIIQDSLLSAEPELKKRYQGFFIAGVQPAGGDGGAQTMLDLRVDGRCVPGVYLENSHLSDYTSSLVQVGQEKGREPLTPSLS